MTGRDEYYPASAGDAAGACADALLMACAAALTQISSTHGGRHPTIAQGHDLAVIMLDAAADRAMRGLGQP
jgi:hypothetical protein